MNRDHVLATLTMLKSCSTVSNTLVNSVCLFEINTINMKLENVIMKLMSVCNILGVFFIRTIKVCFFKSENLNRIEKVKMERIIESTNNVWLKQFMAF